MKKSKIVLGISIALAFAGSFVGCNHSTQADIKYGLKVGNGNLIPFSEALQFNAVAEDITYNSDGSVSYIATAAGGAGGGIAFYFTEKADESIINTANYESVDLEFEFNPVEEKWNAEAQDPGFCLRLLTSDSTGIFGGAVDVEYFETNKKSGSFSYNVKFADTLPASIVDASDYDGIKAFCIKFNDYQRGNTDGDQLKVTIKSVKFNKKAGAGADVPFDDGLTATQRGTVQSIEYSSKDYTMTEDPATYKKHAWVYLPAGYNSDDTETKYPVFILVHGAGQNENTWGLSDQGNGGKIKGYMDRGMADGSVTPFILVVATGVASSNWGPDGLGYDFPGFNAFEGELRNDLLPYIYANYNCIENRESTAFAGLSMGGGQTINIALGSCLDIIANFGAFSPALMTPEFSTLDPDNYKINIEENFPDYKVKTLYMICGDADNMTYAPFPAFCEAMENWNKIEEDGFSYDVVPGGTHDFPVWFKGFKNFITKIFK